MNNTSIYFFPDLIGLSYRNAVEFLQQCSVGVQAHCIYEYDLSLRHPGIKRLARGIVACRLKTAAARHIAAELLHDDYCRANGNLPRKAKAADIVGFPRSAASKIPVSLTCADDPTYPKLIGYAGTKAAALLERHVGNDNV